MKGKSEREEGGEYSIKTVTQRKALTDFMILPRGKGGERKAKKDKERKIKNLKRTKTAKTKDSEEKNPKEQEWIRKEFRKRITKVGRKGRRARREEPKFTFALPPKLPPVVARSLVEVHARRFAAQPDQLSLEHHVPARCVPVCAHPGVTQYRCGSALGIH